MMNCSEKDAKEVLLSAGWQTDAAINLYFEKQSKNQNFTDE